MPSFNIDDRVELTRSGKLNGRTGTIVDYKHNVYLVAIPDKTDTRIRVPCTEDELCLVDHGPQTEAPTDNLETTIRHDKLEAICRTHHACYVRPSLADAGYHAPTDCPDYTGGPPHKAYCDNCRLAALPWAQLPECRREVARQWNRQVLDALEMVKNGDTAP